MKLAQITKIIEEFAPLNYQESYDNAGLIVGSFDLEITGIIISLDVTEAVVDEAKAKSCNLIIAHHPIVFSGLKRLNGSNYIERTVISAIKNDIAIYAAHTNIDAVEQGVNGKICEKLGLKNCKVLDQSKNTLRKIVTFVPNKQADKLRTALFNAGAGHIGNYDNCSYNLSGQGSFRALENTKPYIGKPGELHFEPEIRIETIFPIHLQSKVIKALKNTHPYEEVAYDIYALENKNEHIGIGMVGYLEQEIDELDFLKQIKNTFDAKMLRHTPFLNKKVKKVALCGGSGSFLLNKAIASGADVFLSADFKYHQFFDADNKILIADIGHYESEQFTKEIFYELLTKKITNFGIQISEINTNPVNYI